MTDHEPWMLHHTSAQLCSVREAEHVERERGGLVQGFGGAEIDSSHIRAPRVQWWA